MSDVTLYQRGATVTLTELATYVGLSGDAIRKDVAVGCPVIKKGTGSGDPTILNVYQWYTWKIERTRSEKRGLHTGAAPRAMGTAKDRILEATAAKREAELAKMRGELIAFADLDMLISNEFVQLRTALTSIEHELAEKYGVAIAREVQDRVNAAVNRSIESADSFTEKLEETR